MPGGAVVAVIKPVVEVRRGPAAEVGADREVQRREHLEQDEHDADRGERRGERVAAAAPRRSARPVATASAAGRSPRKREQQPPGGGVAA